MIKYLQDFHVQHGFCYRFPLKNVGICERAGSRSDAVEVLPEEGVHDLVKTLGERVDGVVKTILTIFLAQRPQKLLQQPSCYGLPFT